MQATLAHVSLFPSLEGWPKAGVVFKVLADAGIALTDGLFQFLLGGVMRSAR